MENIKEVLEEWRHTASNKPLKDRKFDISKAIAESNNRIVSITGIRRAGKSSILMLIYRHLKEKALYVNLEDNRLKFAQILDTILKQTADVKWLLLDEITTANDWEHWLNRINEMKTIKIIVSSSLNRLSRFPPKALRGRISYFEMFPLSFHEFLLFKNIKMLPQTTREIGIVENALEEFLVYGGFPEVVISENKVEILQDYMNSIVSLDVALMSNIPLKLVLDFSAQIVVTTFFSATKLENIMKNTGHKVSKSTLLELENLFETAYIGFFVPVFSTKVKDKTLYPRKFYMGDTGFFYAARGKKDYGRLYENAVFLQLRRNLNPLEQISYYKSIGNHEVDFVVRQGLEVKELIQVVYDIKNEETIERELRSLLEAAEEFKLNGKNSELIIITKDEEYEKQVNGKTIIFRKLWKWLIERDS